MALLTAALVMAGLGIPTADVPLPPERPPMTQTQDKAPALPAVAVETEHGPPTDCDKRLAAMAVFTPKPSLAGPGACGGEDLIELDAVMLSDGSRVALAPKATMRCDMAESFAAWLRDEAVPRLKSLNSPLRTVVNEDSYECRGRNRVANAKVSEHGKGNAIDVRGFILADKRRIVLTDVAEPKELREGLRDSACRRFTTVLGPGSDAYHEQHIHLDVLERRAGYRICQWDVREPAPPPAVVAKRDEVPLPPPRPPVPETRKL
ncbi:MAG TPA: extensin family protein [Pseudolabrys sp.]|nr:extensin family protein [Pseudolabrys sp.]